MPADVGVRDGGSSVTARVTEEGAFVTTLSSAVPVTEDVLTIPFSRFLTVNGDGVTSSLTVDGSSEDVEAFIGQDQDGDIYLTQLTVLLAGGTVGLNRFGNLAALANGIQFFYEVTRGRIDFAEPIQTAFGLIRLGAETLPLGSKTDAFEMQNVGVANLDAYLPAVDLARWSPLGFGIRIRRDSLDKLGIVIRDDLSALGAFNILTAGYLRLTTPG